MTNLLCLMFCIFIGVLVKGCQLPPSKKTIDFSKMNSNWYVTFSSKDAIQSEDVKCHVVHDITPKSDGFQFLGTSHFYCKKEPETRFIRKYERPGGYYAAYLPLGSLATDAEGKLNVDALVEWNEINNDVTLHLTDYENYFYHISCDPSGGLLVWGLTQTPDPSAEIILHAVYALQDFGIDTKLHSLNGCSEIYS